jgi:hypothetical protein
VGERLNTAKKTKKDNRKRRVVFFVTAMTRVLFQQTEEIKEREDGSPGEPGWNLLGASICSNLYCTFHGEMKSGKVSYPHLEALINIPTYKIIFLLIINNFNLISYALML